MRPPAPTTIDPRVTPELEAVCLRALRRDKDARYRNALELAEDLRRARARIPAAAPSAP